MKKLTILLLTGLLMMTSSPVFAEGRNITHIPTPGDIRQAGILIARLGEIEKMEKSNLDHMTKRDLHKEVKDIKKELKTLDAGGVYLSVGAIILIVLLLILLL